ncbi:molybdate ABC transporter substrate-binding protein [Leptobacterium flavescens]|uniref:Molybdate ABC transporter substrate-binding protein n=1 Tax=Leptobacterium flavescens TaxID=472055 RepID=A0A6P0UPM0_9FLAO|nr:molybdate ABC transporter substrate-binding protein [Leptobacterium flavescens]NER12863.1 molybdate ABC transporter substrate-binding protein [Leptobacterium flavescens]
MKKTILQIILLITIFGCKKTEPEKLTIATAANMQFVMKELITSFEEQSGVACDAVVSSSGKLSAQIREGAPFDVFVSADMKYPTELFDEGLTEAAPEAYAYGRLVLWSIIDSTDVSIEKLTGNEIKHIALANPKTAPYGNAAIEVLRYNGIYEAVEEKLVFGESISQTNQFVVSSAAEAGFTSKSVVLSPGMKARGRWVAIDPNIHTPITQGVVILKNNRNMFEEAQKFYNFLFSDKGREILRQFGYTAIAK